VVAEEKETSYHIFLRNALPQCWHDRIFSLCAICCESWTFIPRRTSSLLRFTRTCKRIFWPLVLSGMCIGPKLNLAQHWVA